MTAAEIVAKLTDGQQQALLGNYAWNSPWDEEEGECGLYQLGLWNPYPKYGEKLITPLGIEVRTILQKGEGW